MHFRDETGRLRRGGGGRGRAALALLLAAGCGLCSQAPAAEAESFLCGRFASAAPATLLGKLDPAVPGPELPVGVEITTFSRPVGSFGAVLVESTAAQRGTATVAAGALPVLSLAFRLGQRPEDRAYEPLGYRDAEWYGSTFWADAGWTRVGKDWQHPGDGVPSVRRFVAPRDGQVRIRGPVRKLHLDGDGIAAAIWHGPRQVWQATLDGKDATGVDPDLALEVRAGDRIRFVVQQRGTITCDTTFWDPLLTYADGSAFQASAAFGNAQGRGGWSYEAQRAAPAAAAFTALAYRTEEWYGSTFWSGPDWTRVGKDWHHPGENTPSVRRFVPPQDGRIRISGRVRKLHLDGDGVRVLILHGERQVWQAEIEGKDGTGSEPDVALDVRQGEALRFVVHKRGAISCDTTYWDPLVTYADGKAFQASAAFGSTQGAGGWFYEHSSAEIQAVAAPALRVLGHDLLPRLVVAPAGQPQQASAAACLPFAVIAAGDDASGVALALDAVSGWRLEAAMVDALTWRVTLWADTAALAPAATRRLPLAMLVPYEGHWCAGQASLASALAESANDGLGTLWPALCGAASQACADLVRAPEPALLLTAVAEWCREDGGRDTPESYANAVADHLARAAALARRLAPDAQVRFAPRQAALATAVAGTAGGLDAWRDLYRRCRLLKRDIALADPLVADQPLLFCRRRPPNYSHLVMQYYGWRQQPGGGLHILEAPGVSLRTREITAGKLPPGSYLEPRLSYDARQVVFSYVTVPESPINPGSLAVNEEGPDEAYFHVYTMGLDGADLRQVTSGVYDDLMPTWLPDGGIAFCSTRRRAYSRCFGGQFSKRWDSYTLHRVEADGSALRQLSWNDVNEWFPEVANSGHILFARWDYIDRDAVTHQNLWAMRPDGTNQSAVWGNATPSPHCTFQAKAIPGSGKVAFIASAHHSVTGGPLCLLDPAVDSNSRMEAITRLTPQRFPEAEGHIDDYYNSPWPLSERLFLVAYSPERLRFEPAKQPDHALGLYLLDAEGNRELLYRDPRLGSTNPTPLRARPRPPLLPCTAAAAAEPLAEVVMSDVYRGLGAVPRGTIRALRVIQILPKTTPVSNSPPIGLAGEENTRAVLGTVPVEPDGSARFLVPSGKALLFQALDADGCAYQTMRSTTAFQPGEKTSCIGCHENRMSVPVVARPAAQAKPPARLTPGPFAGRPFSYMTVVQPVWDKHCLACHGAQAPKQGLNLTATARGGFAESYWSLCGDAQAFWGAKTNPENAAAALVPRFGARNRIEVTPPGGLYGARGSRLLKLLRAGHQKVALTADELQRIALWIDCNAVFFGSYHPEIQAQELAGKPPPLPEIE